MISNFIGDECYRVLCGKPLGHGDSREVYACAFDDEYVVKIEQGARSFDNSVEWALWHDRLSRVEWASKLFAEPVAISPCGSVMIQRRTEPAREFPHWVPDIWGDLKIENFGMLDGRLVCHDFGNSFFNSSQLGEKPRLVQAKWWSVKDKVMPGDDT